LIGIFKNTINTLDEHGVDYWLEYGTLLGLIRDNGFIPGDTDIDIALDESNFKKTTNLIPIFQKTGFNIKLKFFNSRYATKIIQLYPNLVGEGFHVDLYQFKTINNHPYRMEIVRDNFIASKINNFRIVLPFCNLLDKFLLFVSDFFSFKKILIFPRVDTKEIGFYDIMVKIPANAEHHLCFLYGDNWRTPNRDHINFRDAGAAMTSFRDKRKWVCESCL